MNSKIFYLMIIVILLVKMMAVLKDAKILVMKSVEKVALVLVSIGVYMYIDNPCDYQALCSC